MYINVPRYLMPHTAKFSLVRISEMIHINLYVSPQRNSCAHTLIYILTTLRPTQQPYKLMKKKKGKEEKNH